MRPRLLAMAGLSLWVCVFASGASAQRQLQLYATILDSTGAPAATVTPEDVQGAGKRRRAEDSQGRADPWTTKVQILLDNGTGIGSANLNQLRNGLKGLLEALPLGLEVTLVTTAPQPRFLVARDHRSRAAARGHRPARARQHRRPFRRITGRGAPALRARTRPTSSASSSRWDRPQATIASSTATSIRSSNGSRRSRRRCTSSWCPRPPGRRQAAVWSRRKSECRSPRSPTDDTRASRP